MKATKPALAGLIIIAILAGGCRQSKEAPKPGRLIVLSEPATGAQISLNGIGRAEKTNAVLNRLKPGPYDIELVKADPKTPDQPLVGEARIVVAPSKTTRIVVQLNKMVITPAASADDPTRIKTRSQKTIAEFYDSITKQELSTAFNYLSPSGKRAVGGYWRFKREWANVTEAKISSFRRLDATPETALEQNEVSLEIRRRQRRNRAFVEDVEQALMLFTTVEGSSDVMLPLIDAVIESSGTVGEETVPSTSTSSL